MTKYGVLIRHVDDDKRAFKWRWDGYAREESPLKAAEAVAISAKGYDRDEFDGPAEIVEQFVNDGWRFRLLEIEEEYENSEIA